jgi:putative (di)nucleoside polyphosphate hydrolase
MTKAILPYRPGVGVMGLNREGKVFVGRRIQGAEAWQMPQGGIDDGESPREAAMRELAEETGVAAAEILAETPGWLDYRLPEELIPNLWGGRYAGQRQKWFLLRLLGGDEAVNIHTEHPEFCEWKWAEAASLPDLIVPFKRPLYVRLLDEFRAYLP